MTGSPEQCGRTPDASLYVLGKLQGRQRESFARHLRRCELCADEVDLLQQAAEAVPLLAARQAPPLDAEMRTELRPPTLAMAAGSARAGTAASQQVLPRRPSLRPLEGGASVRHKAGSAGGRRPLKLPVPKTGLVGFVALAVLAIATVALSQRAATVRYYRIQAGWSHGGAALRLDGNRLQLLVQGMPRPANGTGYEVWVVNRGHGQLAPTGTWLHLNRLGQAGVTVPRDYHSWLAVVVYTEPLRGRDTIRSGAVIVGDLRHVS